ncbi:hypothetical protein LCGC14_0625980 [marine sediment metagenome]|uniref:Uncharacterized protein n=1 Tax=marine sediment metagenome TaxID=412755 RepID=A0A0F9R8H6_9ZZZZ
MGYTHYWELKKDSPELSKGRMKDVNKVMRQYEDIVRYENSNIKKPIITNTLIRFNGIGEDGHETFYFETPPKEEKHQQFKDGFLFNFCKTARKPYDIVVCKLLLILKAELQDNMRLSSDGFSNSYVAFDGEWNKAIWDVKQMGYKINAIAYSRYKGDSPYVDCEIKSITKEE